MSSLCKYFGYVQKGLVYSVQSLVWFYTSFFLRTFGDLTRIWDYMSNKDYCFKKSGTFSILFIFLKLKPLSYAKLVY